VRYGSGSGLAIYFEGGGACFNAFTCGLNPSSYDGGNFNSFAKRRERRHLRRRQPENPLADWTFIYVPYCTGDVHAGAAPTAPSPTSAGPSSSSATSTSSQYLERIVPTFLADTDHVLVTGQSAGGFGAAFNYDRIADAFPGKCGHPARRLRPADVRRLHGPCLQKLWRDAWNLDATMPADCADCFPADGGGIVNLGAYLGDKHSGQHLGLLSSLGDNTIRFFFGFGNNNCNALFPSTPVDTFTRRPRGPARQLAQQPADTWGTFYLSGEQHTWIGGGSYFATRATACKLVDWVADLLDGAVANVEP
jgi:hypothetical protein